MINTLRGIDKAEGENHLQSKSEKVANLALAF